MTKRGGALIAAGAAALAAAAGLGARSLASKRAMLDAFFHSSYWLVSLLVVAIVVVAACYLRAERLTAGRLLCRYAPEAAAGLLAATFVFATVRPAQRILADEANLLAVSKAMYEGRSAAMITMQLGQMDVYLPPVNVVVPKRPLLFPYATHLLHALFGYRPAHAFVVNFLTAAFVLAVAFGIGRAARGPLAGAALVCLVLAQPVFGLAAASGAFELFAFGWLSWCLLLLRGALRDPAPHRIGLLFVACLALAHTRYESVVFAALIFGGFLLLRRPRPRDLLAYAPVYALAPLTLLPLLWQQWLTRGQFEAPPGVVPFSGAHLASHLETLVRSFAGFDEASPYAAVANGLGATALLAAVFLAARARRRSASDPVAPRFAGVVAACFVIGLAVVGAFHFADPAHGVAARYYLPFALALSLAPALVLRRLPPAGVTLLAGAAAVALLHHYRGALGDRIANPVLTLQVQRVSELLPERPRVRTVVVSDTPVVYVALGYGAVNADYVARTGARIQERLDDGTFERVVEIQSFDQWGRLVSGALPPTYRTLPIHEFALGPEVRIKVSEVATGRARGATKTATSAPTH